MTAALGQGHPLDKRITHFTEGKKDRVKHESDSTTLGSDLTRGQRYAIHTIIYLKI